MLGVSRSSHIPPWVFSSIYDDFSPFGIGEEDELQFGDGDTNKRHNWSMERLPRTLGGSLHLLYGFHFFHHGELTIFVKIRCNKLNLVYFVMLIHMFFPFQC